MIYIEDVDRDEVQTRLERMHKLVSTMPTSPGVYLIKNAEGTVIYVGKAKNIRKRLQQHFSLSGTFSKSRRIREQGHDIEVFVTRNEKEALLLEYNLIKQYEPKINSRLKDGKTYPFIEVTTGEKFPRFVMTRNKRTKGSLYIGPFSDVRAARQSLRYALKMFPVANCRKEIHLGDSKGWAKTCIRRRANLCWKPCEVEVDVDDYLQDVKHVIDFIEGKIPGIINQLEQKMLSASEKQEFELAAEYRDTIRALKRTIEKQTVQVDSPDTWVLASHQGTNEFGINLLLLRDKRVIQQHIQSIELSRIEESGGEEHFILETTINLLGDGEQEISRLLNSTPYQSLNESFARLGMKVVKPKPKEKALVDLAIKNIKEYLLRRTLLRKKTSASQDRVQDLQIILKMDNPPEIIDVFDISTLQGTANVASCIRFVGGQPYKRGYRRFAIQSVDGQDDFASIKEAVYRRYLMISEGRDPECDFPDLVVIDGGSEQLNSALSSLNQLELEIPVIGLAKKEEEIYLPNESQTIREDINRPGVLLLRTARDEAHRFAVTYNRLKREKDALKSLLDGISGIGPKRKQLLLEKYGSVVNIAKASAETMYIDLKIPKDIASEVIEKCRKFVTNYEGRTRRRNIR